MVCFWKGTREPQGKPPHTAGKHAKQNKQQKKTVGNLQLGRQTGNASHCTTVVLQPVMYYMTITPIWSI